MSLLSPSLLRLSLLMLLAAIAVGCSRPVVSTGYLQDYTSFNVIDEKERKFRMFHEEDFSVDKYFLTKAEITKHDKNQTLPPDAAADGVDLSHAQPILFVVNEPKWQAELKLKESLEEEIIFVVRERLYRYLLREYPHPVRVRYAFVPSDPLVDGYRIIHVDSAITHAKRGSGWLRFLIGYGAGATTIQLEGRLHENPEADKLLGEFALRNDHGGYPHGFLNPRVFRAHYCMKYAVEQILSEFTQELRDYIPAVRPGPEVTRTDVARSDH